MSVEASGCCSVDQSCLTEILVVAPRCRHRFFEDVAELRAQERARNDAKRMEILERRHKQMEELAGKKKQTGSD